MLSGSMWRPCARFAGKAATCSARSLRRSTPTAEVYWATGLRPPCRCAADGQDLRAGRAAGLGMDKGLRAGERDPWKYESPSTTTFPFADRAGNLVACTKTINHFFGSSVRAGGAGPLPQRHDGGFFALDPASATASPPEKKSLSSMSPNFLLRARRLSPCWAAPAACASSPPSYRSSRTSSTMHGAAGGGRSGADV